MASYETDLQNLKNAQRNAAVANLENTRNQALSNLQAEQQQNAANYNQQRNTANTQNRMSAKNFQEYLASTGRANSGLSSQAKMQYGNNLNTSLNSLNAGEAAALADINRRRTDAQSAYDTGLAGANAQIEADYITNLLSERDKELNRQLQQRAADLQERQFQESVRQFNENMALQRQQLQSRFSSGSGGGGSTRSYSSGRTTNNTKASNDVAIKSVSSPAKFSSTKATKWYVNNAARLTSKNQLDKVIASGLSSGKITKADATRIYASYGIR